MSIELSESLQAWSSDSFGETFCREVARLAHGELPLHLALSLGSHVVERRPKVMLLSSEADASCIRVKAGVFFNSVLAGCNCADDPSPMDEHNEYCELWFVIDRLSGETRIDLA